MSHPPTVTIAFPIEMNKVFSSNTIIKTIDVQDAKIRQPLVLDPFSFSASIFFGND